MNIQILLSSGFATNTRNHNKVNTNNFHLNIESFYFANTNMFYLQWKREEDLLVKSIDFQLILYVMSPEISQMEIQNLHIYLRSEFVDKIWIFWTLSILIKYPISADRVPYQLW